MALNPSNSSSSEHLTLKGLTRKLTSLTKIIWEEGRVAAVSHTGRAVASMHSRNAVGQCGVTFIHEYG